MYQHSHNHWFDCFSGHVIYLFIGCYLFVVTFHFAVLPVDCDFHLTDPSGQIHSLGFEEGLKYPVNTECNWLITVDESSTIVLQFHHMFLEYHAECIYDFVQVSIGMEIDSKFSQNTVKFRY